VLFSFVIDRLQPPGSSAGSSRHTCAPRSSSTPCGWRCTSERRGPTSSWSITAMRQPIPSIDYTQILDDHGVPSSIGSVGDAYDNAVAESFVDSLQDRAHR